jgi:hypothetical protein
MIVKIPVLLLSELSEDTHDMVRGRGHGYDVRPDDGYSLLLEVDCIKRMFRDSEEEGDKAVVMAAVKEAESINSKFIIAIAEDDMAGFVQNSLKS